ncbi:MAG: hypothetical protein ACKOBV_04925, partial [Candidatus Kapaibacterium sp.]
MRLCIWIVCVVLSVWSVVAQESVVNVAAQRSRTPWMFVGGFVGYNRNVFQPDFASFPNQPTCNTAYKSGAGNTFSLGLLSDLPLDNTYSVGARLGYTSLGGALTNSSIIGYTADIG